jgi:hypothetical protein
MSLKVKEWKGNAARKKRLSESAVLLGATQNELSRNKIVKKSFLIDTDVIVRLWFI